jgi:cathepsin A (carboxypeptidase C)
MNLLLLLLLSETSAKVPPSVHQASQLAYRRKGNRVPHNSHHIPEGFCGSTKQETGYIKAEDKEYFYWLGKSKRSPGTDPLILWLSGGPGCSSSLAVLVENGPCKLAKDPTTKKLTALDNPYTWTSQANVLWLDQPAGVGFSYKSSTSAESDSTSAQVAKDILGFLIKWLAANQEYQHRPLFIFGESYGGHFAPAAAKAIMQHNKLVRSSHARHTIKLKGIGLGDAMVDPQVQYQYYGKYLASLDPKTREGFLSDAAIKEMNEDTPACLRGINKCMMDDATCPAAKKNCGETFLGPVEGAKRTYFDVRKQTCENPLWCYDFTAVIAWMTLASTRKALGVHEKSEGWAVCNLKVNSHFHTGA